MTAERSPFHPDLVGFECSVCGAPCDRAVPRSVCPACAKPLVARYDLARIGRTVPRASLGRFGSDLWRYRAVLPFAADLPLARLGEGGTPLLPLPRLAHELGVRELWLKEEAGNPTGSFKARGLGMAVTKARGLGVKGLMIPSAGNAGGAAAVYGARAGLPVAVVVPRATTEAAIAEALLAGAHVFTVDGTIATAGKLIAGIAPRIGWFDLATLKEPYRLEGKKTMGLELAEQLGWETPDMLIYPTGGGTGLVGIWKAYDELAALGWIKARQPAFVAVQAEGCAPVVKAWTDGAEVTTMWENAVTDAPGLRVPGPFAGRQMLKILRNTGGHGRAVSEREIVDAQRLLARLEGIWTSPEGAANVAALIQMRDARVVTADTRVMMIFTGCGIKNPPPPMPAPIDLAGSDADALARVKQALGL